MLSSFSNFRFVQNRDQNCLKSAKIVQIDDIKIKNRFSKKYQFESKDR